MFYEIYIKESGLFRPSLKIITLHKIKAFFSCKPPLLWGLTNPLFCIIMVQ